MHLRPITSGRLPPILGNTERPDICRVEMPLPVDLLGSRSRSSLHPCAPVLKLDSSDRRPAAQSVLALIRGSICREYFSGL